MKNVVLCAIYLYLCTCSYFLPQMCTELLCNERCHRTQNHLVLLLLPQQICKELLYNERRLRSQDPGSPSSCPVCVLSILDVLEVLVALYLGCPC